MAKPEIERWLRDAIAENADRVAFEADPEAAELLKRQHIEEFLAKRIELGKRGLAVIEQRGDLAEVKPGVSAQLQTSSTVRLDREVPANEFGLVYVGANVVVSGVGRLGEVNGGIRCHIHYAVYGEDDNPKAHLGSIHSETGRVYPRLWESSITALSPDNLFKYAPDFDAQADFEVALAEVEAASGVVPEPADSSTAA